MIGDISLASHNIFVDPELLSTRIAAVPGQVIYEMDTPARNVYYVQQGEVRLYTLATADAGSRLVAIFGPRVWFGAATLAGEPTHRCHATAMTASVVLAIDVDHLRDLLARRPEASLALNRDLAARLMASTHQTSSMIFEDSNQRLINTLIRFSRSAASTKRGDEVVLRITHDQLAQAIGVARETVSLALTQLRHRNVLRTGRNQLMFNPDVLRKISDTCTPPIDQEWAIA